jgi:hypothetical protein
VNDYNRDVFNGDLGIIEKINRSGAIHWASPRPLAVHVNSEQAPASLAYITRNHFMRGNDDANHVRHV